MRQFDSFWCAGLLTLIAFSLLGCDPGARVKKDSLADLKGLEEAEVSPEGCLNVKIVNQVLRSGPYPILQVTTDFQGDSSMNSRKGLFHTHSAFDLKETKTSSFQILRNAEQDKCDTVVAQTLSGIPLTYKVTSSSPTSLKLSLEKSWSDLLREYEREALKERKIPFELEIRRMGLFHLRVFQTYRGFDAHCRSKKTLTHKIQTDYMWAPSSANLPSQIMMSESFYRRVLTTINADGTILPLPPVAPPPVSEQPVTPPATPPMTPAPEPPFTDEPPVETDPVDPEVPEVPEAPEETPLPDSPESPEPDLSPEDPVLPTDPGPDVVPSLFQRVQSLETDVGMIQVSVSEIRELLKKPLRDEYAKCGP
ncbi:MAG: hypothetical protein ACK5Y2_08715 [Bdellovibrionales bacterium]